MLYFMFVKSAAAILCMYMVYLLSKAKLAPVVGSIDKLTFYCVQHFNILLIYQQTLS